MFYYIVTCDDCEAGYGCNEFSWVKNSQEDGELYETKESVEDAAYKFIMDYPFSYTIHEVTK